MADAIAEHARFVARHAGRDAGYDDDLGTGLLGRPHRRLSPRRRSARRGIRHERLDVVAA
jgi:hypothetical protein